jgi:FMN-dependent NADH-azoreductase
VARSRSFKNWIKRTFYKGGNICGFGIITASGGSYREGTPAAGYDFQEPFLRAIFGLVGVTDITFIHADNLSSDDAAEKSISEARAALQSAVGSW